MYRLWIYLLFFAASTARAVELDVPNGAIVEGSAAAGGIQPDYLVDFNAPAFRKLREFARDVGKQKISTWEKADLIAKFVHREVLPRGSYTDRDYLALLEKYRDAGKEVPLSAYVKCRAGVCRENALVTHLALKEAGIDNKFVYVKVEQKVFDHGKAVFDTIEDHGFSVVNIDGENWIVDSYNSNFHGFSYDQFLNPKLTRRTKLHMQPGAKDDHDVLRRIVRENSYPKVSCSRAFAKVH